ncbi:hypothetical protein DN730_05270 [Marinomonas piezotolerans]|uniref:DUF4148 domain-containing protein n=1 Tax=Marinomonas piezotolerans TaxID=2213058 RepID=A0A370UBA2_9GAMM|nr:hypothetical protein [Marinomonas piezotolerans]RDL45029.1 hypothetical protein DN730_05270 [Marinomonas piezotolerans]
MKKLTAIALSTLTVAGLSTSAFADTAYDDLRESRASYEALSAQLETMGYQAEEVTFDRAMTIPQKEAVYNEKVSELQAEFNRLHSSN